MKQQSSLEAKERAIFPRNNMDVLRRKNTDYFVTYIMLTQSTYGN